LENFLSAETETGLKLTLYLARIKCKILCVYHVYYVFWLRSTVGRTPVFGRRTEPVLRSACSWRV